MSAVVDIRALQRARAQRRAIIGFSIYNLEQGLGVMRAAKAEQAPVLLQVGSSAFGYAGREPLARLAAGLAEAAEVPVGIHLDHATELAEIDACLRLGYTSVMFDGSGLPIEQNAQLTREVVTRAHSAGAWVEAELAGIAGDEDESMAAQAQGLTDPGVAAKFAAGTGIDALAVSVGNVHGIPATPVSLDLELLERIADAVAVPLVLHGASGLPDDQVSAAVELGVAKINVNAELRRAFRQALIDAAADPPAGDGIPQLFAPAIEATRRVAQEKMRAFTTPRVAAGRSEA